MKLLGDVRLRHRNFVPIHFLIYTFCGLFPIVFSIIGYFMSGILDSYKDINIILNLHKFYSLLSF